MSRTIKQLERELGTRLFDRNTRSVRLTASGQALVEPARAVLTALCRAEAAARAADQGEIGLVRIAFAGLSTHRLVGRLARAMRFRHPGIQLELSSQNFAQPAMKRLVQGDTEIIMGRWDLVPVEVSAQVVMADSLVLALPATHALADARTLSIARLAGESFVSLPPHEGAVLPDRLRRLTQTRAEVGCHLPLASVARNPNDPHIVFVPVDDAPLDVDLRMAWRRDDTTPALRAVVDEALGLDDTAVA